MEGQTEPLISVLMGVYNCESTLDESLESIAAQTESNWECIICDDGSTDRTAEVVRRWQKRFPDKIIFLQNEENMGLAPTLNRCLAEAHGQYIARMDGDDRCSPDRFENELAYLTAHPDQVVVSTDMQCFDKEGVWGLRSYPTNPEPRDLVHGVPFCHAACMIRSEALLAAGGYSEAEEYARVEDYELWVRMYALGYRGGNIHEPLYQMRDDRNAASRRKWKYRINEARVRLLAVKSLHLPFPMKIYALYPLIMGLVPRHAATALHRARLGGRTS
ncbi:MAG: glycosyltransferase [Flexilinea sp.]|nr:glycosyltransferase [Flexilinea sp.]